MLSKKIQTKKKNQKNPKRMTDTEKKLYIDFLRDKSDGVCQIPGCSNASQDWEHPARGINRDDRYTIMICRDCHQKADQPSPKQLDDSSRIKLAGKRIAKQNWSDYTS